jgi:hypothetical protein
MNIMNASKRWDDIAFIDKMMGNLKEVAVA